ncbi:hypothetical protein HZ326_31276 [Fusarium oxysporum f. sp. albedinis]|nr:hypothetical protein HZ326_31276 [Fusarium oxysporum f. sp. albedinis]
MRSRDAFIAALPADEETDEKEETLPLIEVADYEEVEMPSSPPYLPDYESSPQLPLPSTPCPYQHRHNFISPSEISSGKEELQ